MLVGEKGIKPRPTHPCRLADCTRLGFLENGVCVEHVMDMADWLRGRVMTRPSPWGGPSTVVQDQLRPEEPPDKL